MDVHCCGMMKGMRRVDEIINIVTWMAGFLLAIRVVIPHDPNLFFVSQGACYKVVSH